MHMEYDDPKEEQTAETSGPAGAVGQRKRSDAQKPKEQKNDLSRTEKDRADAFKRSHPGVTDVPDRMDKDLFKKLTEQHGKAPKAPKASKPKRKRKPKSSAGTTKCAHTRRNSLISLQVNE